MANQSINFLFQAVINKGIDSAKLISDAKDKTMAYAALAQAIAQTGLVSTDVSTEEVKTVTETKIETKTAPKTDKAALKPGADKVKAEPKEEPKVEPKVEQKEEVIADEWNDETIALKAEQIGKLDALKEEYGEEVMNQGVEMFSEGNYKTLEDITPANIDAFLDFVTAMTSSED